MSDCPRPILKRRDPGAAAYVNAATIAANTGHASRGRYAITAVEPLASLAGAAAFLLVFLFSVPPSPRRFFRSRVFVKEPIENQANQYFQT
jgi:hypothetical protein